MKNRIGIAIIALLSVVISCCLVPIGCTPPTGYITIDPGSTVMNPTFCIYHDRYFQKRLNIGSIIVVKADRSSGKKKRWDFVPSLNDYQTVWELGFSDTDSIIIGLLQMMSIPPVSSLTYGEVPWGYQEKVKALPLEPEEFYIVCVNAAYLSRRTEPLRFIIRTNDTGVPDRLEYRLERSYLWEDIFHRTRPDLKLD